MGGVASGLAHYFGLDVGWPIILALMFFFSGGSFASDLYIVLGAHEASTTAEKLQMKGEPVTVGNIEK